MHDLLGGSRPGTPTRWASCAGWSASGRRGRVRAPALRARGAVALLTIHAAKGLEWPAVVVADLAGGGGRDRARRAARPARRLRAALARRPRRPGRADGLPAGAPPPRPPRARGAPPARLRRVHPRARRSCSSAIAAAPTAASGPRWTTPSRSPRCATRRCPATRRRRPARRRCRRRHGRPIPTTRGGAACRGPANLGPAGNLGAHAAPPAPGRSPPGLDAARAPRRRGRERAPPPRRAPRPGRRAGPRRTRRPGRRSRATCSSPTSPSRRWSPRCCAAAAADGCRRRAGHGAGQPRRVDATRARSTGARRRTGPASSSPGPIPVRSPTCGWRGSGCR